MNTGIQRSSATPLGAHTSTAPAGSVKQGKEQNRKDLTKILVAHNIPYVAQTTPYHWKDLANRIEEIVTGQHPLFTYPEEVESLADLYARRIIAYHGEATVGRADPDYQRVAQTSAEYYYKNYIVNGITCGGPGDAMQNPDSESSYAMLESFMLLYESTQDGKWLKMAEEMANQFSSWVMPYDYQFPENSTLGKLGVQTTGMVLANTQNKHGAPGICTHSGIALWRLFRATGNPRYMELLKEIAFVMPQYLSHPVRPIEKMKTGWMSERVSTTDWLEGIGELMYGSTWAETSLMLSYIELPGVYVQPDKALVYVIDNVEAQIVQDKAKSIVLKITNPTKADAQVSVFAESSAQAHHFLGENALYGGLIINLKSGESKKIVLEK